MKTEEKTTTEAKPEEGVACGLVQHLVIFFCRNFQCRFGVHWRMKYDSGLKFGVCRAGTCTDCGYRTEGIKFSPFPKKKYATCGVVPKGTVMPTMGMTERAWWKCKKCGVVYEAWSFSPLHNCDTDCVNDYDLAGR